MWAFYYCGSVSHEISKFKSLPYRATHIWIVRLKYLLWSFCSLLFRRKKWIYYLNMFNFARYTYHDNNLCNCCLSPLFFRLKIKLTLFLSLKNTCMTLFTCKTIDLYVLVSSSRGVKAILLKKYLNWCHMCCKGGGLTLIGMSYESKKKTLL
jgi:hypothetical protein